MQNPFIKKKLLVFANKVAQSVTAERKLLRLVKTMLSGKGPWQSDINIHYSCLESMKIHFCSARAHLFMAVRARLQFAMLIRAEHERYTHRRAPRVVSFYLQFKKAFVPAKDSQPAASRSRTFFLSLRDGKLRGKKIKLYMSKRGPCYPWRGKNEADALWDKK